MAILASNNPFTAQPAIVTPKLFKGNFLSIEALKLAYPNPEAGSTANIIQNGATDDLAIWDTGDAVWVVFAGKAVDITGKVDKAPGYSLTKNDLTDELKATYDAAETNAKSYADGLITQLIDGAPADGNTLKELNDKILAVQAIIGGTTADGDALVNTVAELLAVFSTYTEGVDLVTLLAGKVNTTDVYNALDSIVAGKVLDAQQGKVLKDLIDALTLVVNSKEPANANIQAHIGSAHAPSNAQKNSDITKAEIEAKLTGEITTHTHTATAQDPSQITITTAVSITTDTLGDLGKTQKEKNVIIDNGVNAINITVNGGTNFLASYLKHGTGAITFVQGAGRTLIQVDGLTVLDGAVGGTATISSVGTTDYLRISKAS